MKNEPSYTFFNNPLNPLARWGATIPTSPTCGYDAKWGILC